LRHKGIGTIIRLIGYLLLPTYEYDVVVMLFGKGANGKSTLLKLIEAFLGAFNCSHRSLQQIDTDRFADMYVTQSIQFNSLLTDPYRGEVLLFHNYHT
jgi:phage/plasmid-associated DNA primase